MELMKVRWKCLREDESEEGRKDVGVLFTYRIFSDDASDGS